MTPDRWQHINRLFQEALDHSTSERSAFLDEACAGDEDSRNQVQSLISFDAKAQEFLEVPALEVAARWFAGEPEETLVGTQIGSYKIEARLGAGGMGEVYLAEDTKLDRKVAIKFLPREMEEDELARRRQIREAKAAARLEHPNICGIHEVATQAGHSFIVMQYVEGETVSARMRRRPLRLTESLDVALQVADALSLAHSRGIVHRDIKPQNIMITTRGQVKVLDFGLAKIVVPETPEQDKHHRDSDLSKPGLVVGTVPYMSPEQAKGIAIDGRSDLFSLGVVLYECITQKPAFAGKTPLEICAQVIHVDPPPPSAANDRVPPELDRIILKALAKDRDSRQQSAEELQKELRAVRGSLGVQDEVTRGLAVKLRVSRADLMSRLIGAARRPQVLVPLVPAALVLLAALSVPLWWRAAPYRPQPDALRWYEQGTAALRDGTYYKASKALEEAIKFDDKFALAHARLAEAWSELDYADKADREILRARSLVRDLSALSSRDALYLQAITHVVLREFDAAIERYRKIAEQAPAAEKAQAYLDLGRAQEQNDDIKGAQASYEQATALAPQDAAAFLRLGILFGKQQDLEKANRAFKTAESLYHILSNNEGEAEVFYQRGFLYHNLNKPPQAQAQLDEAYKLSSSPVSQYQQIRILLVLSGVSVTEGRAAQAEQQARQAIQLARNNGIENQATNGLIWLGSLFLHRGEYDEADKYYRQALDLAQRDNGRLNQAWASMQLGSLRSLQRNTDEALRYVEQALPFYQQGGYRKWLSQALVLLGRIHRDRGEYEDALRALQEQLDLAERVGDQAQVALSHQEIGSVLSAEEQYPEALLHFDESHSIRKSLNANVSTGYALMYRASVLWQVGSFEEARRALDEAAVIAGPEKAYKELLAEIDMIGGRLELSEGHPLESKMKSHQALALAGNQYPDTAAQAKLTLGLAETRSGGVRAGARLCAQALDIATSTRDPQLVSSALLAFAETLLESGEAQRALDTALRAKDSFARFGQLESEWRAWLIAAQAKRHLNEDEAAHEYASTATARLSNLEQRFGSEAYNSYLKRPDVQQFRKTLNQQLNP
ncbi:MAG TPA: protein kinase [Blastocatellia bacterium]|nr:protein kinase [Blastocatellia bacterium]